MIWSRKPIDIVAETLEAASDDVFEVSEDIIAALEDAGWRFSWCGDVVQHEQRIAA